MTGNVLVKAAKRDKMSQFKVGDRVVYRKNDSYRKMGELATVWNGNAGSPEKYGEYLPVRFDNHDYGINPRNVHSSYLKVNFRLLTSLDKALE